MRLLVIWSLTESAIGQSSLGSLDYQFNVAYTACLIDVVTQPMSDVI